MIQLKEVMMAPVFEGTDQDGKSVKLADFAGKKVVLYFYPKDNTANCTE
jgi:peroxiredoxin Q/BCP